MPSINKCLVLLALTLSTASALSHNGHIARSNSHSDIAARNVVVDTHSAKRANVLREASLKRRASNSARCKTRPTSSSHKAEATPAKAVAADPPKSSSKKDKPKPSSSSAHKAEATKKADVTSSSGNAVSDALASFEGGAATFFFQNGNAGACGKVHSDSDFVVALFTSVYANGKYCGKQVKLTNTKTGDSQTATVADECPTCKGPSFIDCSKGLASALGITEAMGEADISYEILP